MARREMAAKINERGELRDIFGGFLRQVRINTSLVGSALLCSPVGGEGRIVTGDSTAEKTATTEREGEGREEGDREHRSSFSLCQLIPSGARRQITHSRAQSKKQEEQEGRESRSVVVVSSRVRADRVAGQCRLLLNFGQNPVREEIIRWS